MPLPATSDACQDIREAVRALCAQFPMNATAASMPNTVTLRILSNR